MSKSLCHYKKGDLLSTLVNPLTWMSSKTYKFLLQTSKMPSSTITVKKHEVWPSMTDVAELASKLSKLFTTLGIFFSEKDDRRRLHQEVEPSATFEFQLLSNRVFFRCWWFLATLVWEEPTMGPGIQRSTLDLEPHSNKESIFILWLRATSGKNNFEHWTRLSITFLLLVNPLSWEIGLLSPDINWFRTKTTELDNYNVVSVMEL